MSTTVTIDEHGVVFVHEDGQLTMFMHRRDYDTVCAELGLPMLDPEPVISGGGILYSIDRSTN